MVDNKWLPRLGGLLFLSALLSCFGKGDRISYSEDVKPLLNQKCLRCHGGIKVQGEFSLLFKDMALAENESGSRAIIPGNAAGSELIKRIKETDPELRMPKEGNALTETEITLLEDWINQGAEWDDHWSYVKPIIRTPEIDNDWIQHDIDRYILQVMQQNELDVSPRAEKHELLRRFSLDITGLPPSPELADLYLAGILSESEVMDRLLQSPHYGEHWSSMWLDLARYADTKGYEKDAPRSIWRYRDWVIDAYNQDMPFTQFTIDQLAGDLVENATADQMIATAFHRNTMTNTEGGTEDEEFRSAAGIDRVNTTFEVWQGMTMSCVQCHSHPYDPIKHEDFYGLYAIFNNTMDADLDSEFPFMLEVRDSLHANEIDELSQWLGAENSPVRDQVIDPGTLRSIISPRLIPALCDDFKNVLISKWGGCNNRSTLANNQKDKKYYLLYEDLALDELTGFRFSTKAHGDAAEIRVHKGSDDGQIICTAPIPESKKWRHDIFPVSETLDGRSTLVFEIVNTTGLQPDGLVDLYSIEPIYGHTPIAQETISQQDSLLKLYGDGIETPVMREKSKVLWRTSQVFDRGSYLAKTDTVFPSVPDLYHYEGEIKNRLDLAHMFIHENNPLTGRVYVNRVWNRLFGRGLVETLGDFGSQATPSEHRDLLDYLAVQFTGDWQWSTKRLVKEILSSATYQQSSDWDAIKIELDPQNLYYSRAPRTRLSAEQIRDQALAVSGLLTPELKGPSVMPPQPPGIWKMPYSSEKWENADDEQRYRRGLYTYWRRTTPYPSLIAFDSPTREVCVSKRINTNTPLQALVTLNDPVYLEAAQELGNWMKKQDGGTGEKIAAGYRRALFRDPTVEELQVLLRLFDDTMIAKPTPTETALDPFDLVGNTILNLDALLTKS